jgi:hypothetical protein
MLNQISYFNLLDNKIEKYKITFKDKKIYSKVCDH